jgi:Mrp family chromosome partitioning ATPase
VKNLAPVLRALANIKPALIRKFSMRQRAYLIANEAADLRISAFARYAQGFLSTVSLMAEHFETPDLRSAHVIVLGDEKGGTGKSTLSIHITIALLKAGCRVASIDLDVRQRTLTRFLENRRS